MQLMRLRNHTRTCKIFSTATKNDLLTIDISRNVDDVHELMDNIAEQNDVAKEISDAISTGLGLGSAVDDDDLLNELNDLEQEELDKDLLNVGPSTTKLPDVPSTDLPTTSKEKKKGEETDLVLKLISERNYVCNLEFCARALSFVYFLRNFNSTNSTKFLFITAFNSN